MTWHVPLFAQQMDFITLNLRLHIFDVWSWYDDLTTVLHSSGHVGACYVTFNREVKDHKIMSRFVIHRKSYPRSHSYILYLYFHSSLLHQSSYTFRRPDFVAYTRIAESSLRDSYLLQRSATNQTAFTQYYHYQASSNYRYASNVNITVVQQCFLLESYLIILICPFIHKSINITTLTGRP
jgi:hypothetical protein